MWYRRCVALLLFALATPLAAKPVLNDSQQTWYSACVAAESPALALTEICQAALSEPGLSPRQRLDVQVELADALYDLERYDAAEAVYDKIVLQAPGDVRIVNGLAWVYWSRDEYARAAETFEQSVAIIPTAIGLAGLASSRRHMDKIGQDGFAELLEAALALSPDYVWAQRELGWGYIDFEDYEAAEAAFRTAIDMDPGNQWSLYALGRALNEQNRYADAVAVLIQVQPGQDTPTGYFSQLSLARFHTGDYKAALKSAERVIEGWPDNNTGYVRKARAMAALGRQSDAIVLLQDRMEIKPSSFVGYWLAELLYDDARLKDAMKVLDRLIAEGLADSYDLELRAFLALELKDFDEARVSVQSVLQERPASAYGLYYKALLQVEDSAFDSAETTMEQALDNGLPDSRIRYFLSAVMGKGEFVRAIQWRVKMRARSQ